MTNKIEEILAKRGDLSTFLVHLIHASDSSKDALNSIINNGCIESKKPWGMLRNKLDEYSNLTESQKCACFTETPLEFLWSLCEGVEGCDHHPQSNYGIVITKRQARKAGVNPVWYIDQTPGHDWLSEKTINPMIKNALDTKDWENGIFKLTPFFEIMGSWQGQPPKEFWWEREWRHIGNFTLPKHFITICPKEDHDEVESLITGANKEPHLIDSKWSMEEMVANLAHFDKDEI